MPAFFRNSLGVLLSLSALGAYVLGVFDLRARDYLAAFLFAAIGTSMLRAGMELLRPSLGE